jgi:hypothetical protein
LAKYREFKAVTFNGNRMAYQRLTRGDAADVQRKIGEHHTRPLAMEMPELETPAIRLAPRRKRQVPRVECKYEARVEHAHVEPLGQHEFQASPAGRTGGQLFALVGPEELPAAGVLTTPNYGAEGGCQQRREYAIQGLMLVVTGGACDGDQQPAGCETEALRCPQIAVQRGQDQVRGPDQHSATAKICT